MKITAPLTITITSYCRPVSLLALVTSITNQTIFPTELVVVENSQVSSKSNIDHLLKNTPITLQYISTKKSGISQLRNLALQKATNRFVACIDDDVLLPNNYVAWVEKHLSKYPDTTLLFCKVLPKEHSLWSMFTAAYANQAMRDLKKVTKVSRYFPFSAVVLDKDFSVRNNINFDTQLSSGEDIDFTLKIIHKKGAVYFDPTTCVLHAFPTTLRVFWQKQSWYAHNFVTLYARYGVNSFIRNYFPQRKLHILFLPFIISWTIFDESHRSLKNFCGSPICIIPAFIQQLAFAYGAYASPAGKEMFREQCLKVIKQ